MNQGVAAKSLVLRLLHFFEFLFSDSISVRPFRNFFAQGQDAWLIKANQGNAHTTTEERV